MATPPSNMHPKKTLADMAREAYHSKALNEMMFGTFVIPKLKPKLDVAEKLVDSGLFDWNEGEPDQWIARKDQKYNDVLDSMMYSQSVIQIPRKEKEMDGEAGKNKWWREPTSRELDKWCTARRCAISPDDVAWLGRQPNKMYAPKEGERIRVVTNGSNICARPSFLNKTGAFLRAGVIYDFSLPERLKEKNMGIEQCYKHECATCGKTKHSPINKALKDWKQINYFDGKDDGYSTEVTNHLLCPKCSKQFVEDFVPEEEEE